MTAGSAALEKPIEQPQKHRYTYDELVAEMPETNQPCELWDGEIIMSPAPSFDHQEIVFRFARRLYDWVSKRKLGKVVTAPIDMVLSPHRAMQPEVAFIAKDRLGIIRRAIHGPVDLAVELNSLGNRNRDRIEKRDLYEQYGVKEYWIVDPEAQTIEVFYLTADRYRLHMRCHGDQTAASHLLRGFKVSVNDVFYGK
jgi:Uma2 family endonuclease